MRRKLNGVYGSKYSKSKHNPKLIPAHLLGNMWSQSWEDIFDLLKPYPNVEEINLDKKLKEKNYTVIKMFKDAEEFFESMGLFKMNPTFWKYSMLEKPENRSAQCHATATSFYNAFDYR